MEPDGELTFTVLVSDPLEGPLEPSRHDLGPEDTASAGAGRAVGGHRVPERRPHPLTGHLDQAQLGHGVRLGAGPVADEVLPELLQDPLLVAAGLHVDEIADDDATDVAEPDLAGDLAGAEYVGVDVKDAAAELEGTVESIPVPDGSYQVVLCTQVLEHADDPAAAIRELRRVTAPGGRVLLSTHGTQIYHPNPDDYWRWTHAGLEKLFRENGDWASLAVRPGSGTAACIGMLVNIYVDIAFRRAHLAPLARAFCATVNSAAAAIDARSPRLREPGHTTLFANFHVVAEVPS